ncbi:hypothetical protein H2198_001039 [Neophaeococcomyces mojaviensis]|uniref:Uncharacterized protein n=1 Tax=Neophaeococcomyces mojaviensis TaxID=3383035 RepID=A0ACC3AI39_9EURO|nr:hypothetical protein H2198_001039 [Knufia sp. JES_112]
MPFRSSTKQLKQQLEQQYAIQQQKDIEHGLQRTELEAKIRQHQREEYRRQEVERTLREQQQRDREQEEMRQKRIMLEQRERDNGYRERLRKTTPEALRHVRDLIRIRYYLDIHIWNCRGVQKADRALVMQEAAKADAILQEIYDIIGTWEESLFPDNPEEWRVAKKIRD